MTHSERVFSTVFWWHTQRECFKHSSRDTVLFFLHTRWWGWVVARQAGPPASQDKCASWRASLCTESMCISRPSTRRAPWTSAPSFFCFLLWDASEHPCSTESGIHGVQCTLMVFDFYWGGVCGKFWPCKKWEPFMLGGWGITLLYSWFYID